MTNDEKIKVRQKLAKAEYKAHEAYLAASNACAAMDIDCRNIQHIVYVGARDKVYSLMVNGEIK